MPSSGADATWGESAPAAAFVGRKEAAADNAGMQRRIVGYPQDAERHWVAELDYGHNQHVRHQPLWTHRPWVVSPGGRARHLGALLECRKCDRGAAPDRGA